MFIASEALTPVLLDVEMTRTGLERDALAAAWNVEPRQLDSEVRKRLIFAGDEVTYASAKSASDGFEHGFLDFERVRTLSRDVRDSAARHVRIAILGQSGLADGFRKRLDADPFDVPLRSHLTRYLWGEFEGAGPDLALPELEYPHFEWHSRLKEFKRDGRKITMTPEETTTARFSDSVSLTRMRSEGWAAEGVQLHSSSAAGRIRRADGSVEDMPNEPQSGGETGDTDLTIVSAVAGLLAVASAAMPPLYKNCTALNHRYPHGVGKVGARDHASGDPVTNFKRGNALYRTAMSYNAGLDRDKDGIACEKL